MAVTEMPLSLTEAATAVRDGEMTSVELTTTALERADALEPRLGVYLSRLDDRAMDAASRADADLATGRDRGILQGIPVGLEEIPAGAEGPAGPTPVLDPAWAGQREAPAAARIRRAGAVITGKVSTSASAVGVAAGLFLAGVGPDTGHGIRSPAAFCGISGLVPTSGRVPGGDASDRVTSVARSARDCAAVLEVIAGHRPGDLGALCGSLAGVRLGVEPANPHPDDADPFAAGLADDAIDVLGNLGADVVEVAHLSADVDVVVGAPATAGGHRESRDRPALIVPMGFGSRGQPVSLRITGHPFGEATVLRVGNAYQQITDWHRQVPDLARA